MDMKNFLQQATPEQREELALRVGSSVGYFYLIAGGHRKAGSDLCKSLVAAETKLTLAELRPDIWGDAPKSLRRQPDRRRPESQLKRETKPPVMRVKPPDPT